MFQDGAGGYPIATAAKKTLIDLAARTDHRNPLTTRCRNMIADDVHPFGAPSARFDLPLFAAPLTPGDTPSRRPMTCNARRAVGTVWEE